jgi:hypothetical protein
MGRAAILLPVMEIGLQTVVDCSHEELINHGIHTRVHWKWDEKSYCTVTKRKVTQFFPLH